MGRRKSGESEKDILKQLAQERRDVIAPQREKRDLRIVKLAEMGVLHADIARAVGLSTESISTVLKRRKLEGKSSCSVGSGGNRGFCRRDSVDGLPV